MYWKTHPPNFVRNRREYNNTDRKNLTCWEMGIFPTREVFLDDILTILVQNLRDFFFIF